MHVRMHACTCACLPVHIAAASLKAAASLFPWLRDMKWFERADDMYLDFSACRSVLNTPIPFAVRVGEGGRPCQRRWGERCTGGAWRAATHSTNPESALPAQNKHHPACAQYISHLRTFMVLWLAVVPWVFVVYFNW